MRKFSPALRPVLRFEKTKPIWRGWRGGRVDAVMVRVGPVNIRLAKSVRPEPLGGDGL